VLVIHVLVQLGDGGARLQDGLQALVLRRHRELARQVVDDGPVLLRIDWFGAALQPLQNAGQEDQILVKGD
jgi:hypothetical protein